MIELQPEEQETSISQCGDDRSEWTIVTSDNIWRKRLAKLGYIPYQEKQLSSWYKIPDSCITIRKPKKSRTEVDKLAIADRMAKARSNREKNRQSVTVVK